LATLAHTTLHARSWSTMSSSAEATEVSSSEVSWPADATESERVRFLAARKGQHAAAVSMFQQHLHWRMENLPLPEHAPHIGEGLPELVRFTPAFARDGTRVVYMLGGMYDVEAASCDAYVLALAALFDSQLNRSSTEKLTIVVDVRGGEGWSNPSATSAIPFVRAASSVLSANFPERMCRMILVPLPWLAATLWSVAKQLLDPITAEKIVVIHGAADRLAELPEGVGEYLAPDAMATLHGIRQSLFVRSVA